MRELILFFILLLVGTVFADEVVVNVESPINRTYDGVSSEDSSFFWGLGLSVLGVGILTFLGYNFVVTRFPKRKKLLFTSKPKSKAIFSDQNEEIKVLVRPVIPLENEDDKEEELLKLKEEIKSEYPKILEEEVKKVLRVTDDLLGQMSEEKVNAFVLSPEFETYKKVMKKVHEPLKEDKKVLEILDKVLDLFEKGLIEADEARKMLGLPIWNISPVKVEKKDKGEVLRQLKKVRDEEN